MYLLRLVWSGKLPETRVVQLGGMKFRFWSEQDVTRAVEFCASLRAVKRANGKAGKRSGEATKCRTSE